MTSLKSVLPFIDSCICDKIMITVHYIAQIVGLKIEGNPNMDNAKCNLDLYVGMYEQFLTCNIGGLIDYKEIKHKAPSSGPHTNLHI